MTTTNDQAFYLIDDFVRQLEEEGVPFQEILALMREYIELCEELVL